MIFLDGWGEVRSKKQLDFGGDPGHDPDPGFLDPGNDLDSGIFKGFFRAVRIELFTAEYSVEYLIEYSSSKIKLELFSARVSSSYSSTRHSPRLLHLLLQFL